MFMHNPDSTYHPHVSLFFSNYSKFIHSVVHTFISDSLKVICAVYDWWITYILPNRIYRPNHLTLSYHLWYCDIYQLLTLCDITFCQCYWYCTMTLFWNNMHTINICSYSLKWHLECLWISYHCHCLWYHLPFLSTNPSTPQSFSLNFTSLVDRGLPSQPHTESSSWRPVQWGSCSHVWSSTGKCQWAVTLPDVH